MILPPERRVDRPRSPTELATNLLSRLPLAHAALSLRPRSVRVGRTLRTAPRAVVCVHHLRKSDGGEGTAARGSGALVGFVDVVVELRRAPKATDPHGRRRMLKGYGRMSGIPDELLVEMDENGSTFHHIDTESSVVETREQLEEGRKDALREAILLVLGDASTPLTRDDIWSRLPDGVKVNETRFRTLLEADVGNHWAKSGTGARANPFRYRRIELVTHPGEEQGGEE